MDRAAVLDGDHVMDRAIGGVDLPMGRVQLHEGRPLLRSTVPPEDQLVAIGNAVADEVDDDVAIGLTSVEDELIGPQSS